MSEKTSIDLLTTTTIRTMIMTMAMMMMMMMIMIMTMMIETESDRYDDGCSHQHLTSFVLVYHNNRIFTAKYRKMPQ